MQISEQLFNELREIPDELSNIENFDLGNVAKL
jgi:hypothetical protein